MLPTIGGSGGGAPARATRISQPGAPEVNVNPTSLAGGGIGEKAGQLFRDFDTNGRNHLDHEQLMAAFAEFAKLNGISSKVLSDILAFTNDSSSRSRTYNLQEFTGFYERLANFQSRSSRAERIKVKTGMPGVPPHAESDELVKRVFINYCKYTVGQGRLTFDEADPKMSSTQFVKLCQDLGLVQPNGPLNVVVIDVVFHKCKPVGARRLGLQQYIQALAAAGEDSQVNVFELIGILGMQIKPRATFVAPQPVVYRQEIRNYNQMERVSGENSENAGSPSEAKPFEGGDGFVAAPWGGQAKLSGQRSRGLGNEDYSSLAPNQTGGEGGAAVMQGLRFLEKRVGDLENGNTTREAAMNLKVKQEVSAAVKNSVGPEVSTEVAKLVNGGELVKQVTAQLNKEGGTNMKHMEANLKRVEEQSKKDVEMLNKKAEQAIKDAAKVQGDLKSVQEAGKKAEDAVKKADEVNKKADEALQLAKKGEQQLKTLEGASKKAEEAAAAVKKAETTLKSLEANGKKVDEAAAAIKKVEDKMKSVDEVTKKADQALQLGTENKKALEGLSKHVDEVSANCKKIEVSVKAVEGLGAKVDDMAKKAEKHADQFKQLEASSKVAGEAIEVAKRAEQSLKKLETAGLVADEALTLAKKGEQHGKVLEARLQEMDEVAIKAEKAVSKTSKMEQDVQDLDEALRKQVKDMKDQGGKVALMQTDLEQVRLDFEARIARLEKIVVVLQDDIDGLKSENRNLAQKAEQAHAEKEQVLRSSNATVAEVSAQHQALLKQLEQRQQTLETKHASLEGDVRRTAEITTETAANIAARTAQMEKAINKVDSELSEAVHKQSKMESSVKKAEAAISEVAELERKAADLEVAMKKNSTITAGIERNFTDLEAAVKKSESRAMMAEEQVKSSVPRDAMDRNAQTIVVIDKRTAELEEELRKLTGPASATANLERKIVELEEMVKRADRKAAEVEGIMKATAPAVAAIAALDQKTEALERVLRDANGAITGYKGLEARTVELESSFLKYSGAIGSMPAMERSVQMEETVSKSSAVAQLEKRMLALEAWWKRTGDLEETEHRLKGRIAAIEETQRGLMGGMEALRLLEAGKLPGASAGLEQQVQSLASKLVVVQKNQEAKVIELERRLTAGERAAEDLNQNQRTMQAAQDTLIANTTLLAQTVRQNTGGMGGDEDNWKPLQEIRRDLKTLYEEIGGFKTEHQTAMVFIKSDLEQLERRLTQVESDKERVMVEAKELENHMLSRLGFHSDDIEAMRKTVNDLVGDLSRIQTQQGGAARSAAPAANAGISPEVLKDIEAQLQAHLDTMYQGMLTQLESRMATVDQLRRMQEQGRANDEAILQGLKELDKRLQDRVTMHDEALVKMARSIDSLQSYLKQDSQNSSGGGRTTIANLPGGLRMSMAQERGFPIGDRPNNLQPKIDSPNATLGLDLPEGSIMSDNDQSV